ncbi:MAG: hypothetical protein GX800_01505, partial [Clostridiaceae bacterium]|nr:hypothetical protein [Clostridiaceae bacterium]
MKKIRRLLSILVVLSMLLSIVTITYADPTVLLNEAFESPVADNANYATEGGWTGISTNKGGQDAGYDGTYGFAPVSRAGSQTWRQNLKLTKYFLSPGMKATSGKYTIRFMYNRGSKSAESNVYVNANGDE